MESTLNARHPSLNRVLVPFPTRFSWVPITGYDYYLRDLKLRLGHRVDNVATHIGIILKQEANSITPIQNKEPEEHIEYYDNADADADADADDADADGDGDVEILLKCDEDNFEMADIRDTLTLSTTTSQSVTDCLPKDELDLLRCDTRRCITVAVYVHIL
jgi:hypothetical protein